LTVGYNAKLHSYSWTSILPLGVHLAARIAKTEENWDLWIFCHGWWHILGPALTFMMYEDEARAMEFLKKPTIRGQVKRRFPLEAGLKAHGEPPVGVGVKAEQGLFQGAHKAN